MNIVVGSAFRNFAARVQQYLRRVDALQQHAGPNHHVRVIAVEGDSKDSTREELEKLAPFYHVDLELVTCNHGLRAFGSTEDTDRMIAMSKVGNAIFDSVRETDDVLLYVECDLLWDAHTAGSLIDMALRMDGGFDVFSPRVMAGKTFYDVWGFRKLDGTRFSPFEVLPSNQLMEVSSVGSCLAMRGAVARRVRIEDDYCLVGWCQSARGDGYNVAIHTGFEVNHP